MVAQHEFVMMDLLVGLAGNKKNITSVIFFQKMLPLCNRGLFLGICKLSVAYRAPPVGGLPKRKKKSFAINFKRQIYFVNSDTDVPCAHCSAAASSKMSVLCSLNPVQTFLPRETDTETQWEIIDSIQSVIRNNLSMQSY